MTPRLATSVIVGGLIRKAESEGGFAAVLAKGDPTAGSLLVLLAERGTTPWILERILQADGRYEWQHARQVSDNPREVPEFIARRRRFDPDLWILELDIPARERFAAEMNAFD